MKILLATSKAIPSGGGIASYNQELIRLFGKTNIVDLLTDSDEHEVEGYCHCNSTFGYSNQDYEYCKELIECINSLNYDCIINSNSAFIPIIAPFLNSPIISVSHFVNGMLAINAGYNAEYLSGIVALSEYGKNFICKEFNVVDQNKVKVIYNFVEATHNSFNESKINRKPLTIVYPGGTSIAKSVDVIQRLVYRLLSTNLDFKFYWLGGTRLPSSKFSLLGLHNTTDLFPNDKRLELTGLVSREKAMSIMADANIFLLPSRGEGCPMTLLEAMRGGCIPIVSDAKHGSREILEKADIGFIVKQGSSRQLADTISEIISNHELYKANYNQSKEFLNSSLSQEIWAKQMVTLIQQAISKPRVTITLTDDAFRKSATRFKWFSKMERIKAILRSILYRIKFDISYLSNLCRMYR